MTALDCTESAYYIYSDIYVSYDDPAIECFTRTPTTSPTLVPVLPPSMSPSVPPT